MTGFLSIEERRGGRLFQTYSLLLNLLRSARISSNIHFPPKRVDIFHPYRCHAHGHRGQTQGAGGPRRALRSLRRPPHRRHLVCWRVAGRTSPPPIGTESGSSLEVFNQSPYPSIGISIPYGDRNCVIPSSHRQNSDICGAKC